MIDPMTAMTLAKVGTGLVTSATQGIKANKLKNQAEAAMPEMMDPMMASYLSELEQKKRSMETGAEFASAIRNADQTTASTQENLTNITGGDVGATIQAMLQAQSVGNRAKNEAIARGQQNQLAIEGLYGNTLRRIADQKLQLQMQRSQQKMAEWAAMKKGANQNTMGTVGASSGLIEPLTNMVNKFQADNAWKQGGAETLQSKDPSSMLGGGAPDASTLDIIPSGGADVGTPDLSALAGLGGSLA